MRQDDVLDRLSDGGTVVLGELVVDFGMDPDASPMDVYGTNIVSGNRHSVAVVAFLACLQPLAP